MRSILIQLVPPGFPKPFFSKETISTTWPVLAQPLDAREKPVHTAPKSADNGVAVYETTRNYVHDAPASSFRASISPRLMRHQPRQRHRAVIQVLTAIFHRIRK